MKNLKVIAVFCMVLVAQMVQTNLLGDNAPDAGAPKWYGFWIHVNCGASGSSSYQPRNIKVTLTKVVNNTTGKTVTIMNDDHMTVTQLTRKVEYKDQQFWFPTDNTWTWGDKGLKVTFAIQYDSYTAWDGWLTRNKTVTYDYVAANYFELYLWYDDHDTSISWHKH